MRAKEAGKPRELRYLIRDLVLGALLLGFVATVLWFVFAAIFSGSGAPWQESWLYGKWADLLLWFQYIVL